MIHPIRKRVWANHMYIFCGQSPTVLNSLGVLCCADVQKRYTTLGRFSRQNMSDGRAEKLPF